MSDAQMLEKFAGVLKAVAKVEVLTVKQVAKRVEEVRVASLEGRTDDVNLLINSLVFDVLEAIRKTTFDANALALTGAVLRVRDVVSVQA